MRRLVLISVAAAATTLAGGLARAQAPTPQDIIKAWDKDGDGAVSKEEWVGAGRPADRFDLVDVNHDGKITVDELASAMARRQGGGASANAAPGQPASPPTTSAAPPPAAKPPR